MRLKIVEKVINDYEIKEIALNPTYLTNDDLKSLKNQGVLCTLDERKRS